MDSSEQYIEMCRMAQEIQSLFEIADGDFCYKEVVFCICEKCNVKDSYGRTYIDEHNKSEYIWLPRQDQLQEMLIADDRQQRYCELWHSFKKYVMFELVNSDDEDLTSFEQLWLCSVMKEKYNKIWNGSDWVVNI